MKELQQDIKTYLEERGWDKLRPADVAKSISIEAAELLEVFQWDTGELEAVKKDSAKLGQIKDELPDVFIYCLEMAVLLDLDPETIIRDKLKKVREKYPADVFKKAEKVPGTDLYWEHKNKHRAEKKG